ncbi:MAG: HAD family phosphatase [Defluviitaleaceae bacterium]|nr:HAD family phosphatase [Defluviitaleaceae bacterium]
MKAHIFDLDGTLIDSMGLWVEIDRQFLTKRGIPFPTGADYDRYVEATVPLSPTETAAHTIQFFGLTETVEAVTREWHEQAVDAYSNTIPLKPYAKEYLQALRAKGAKMAIATSSPENLCMPALRNHDMLDLFDAVCLSEEVGCGKNRPDVFLLAAKRLGVAPEDCMVYEDSLVAIKTAKSVGMTVCAVYDEASAKNWEEIRQIADYAVDNFKNVNV